MASAPLAVVTGGSSGIGAAIAGALAADGHDVVLVARSPEALDATAKRLEAAGGSASSVVADLATDGGVDRIERLVLDRQPDIVVNCAGSGWRGRFAEQSHDDLDALVRLDVVALAHLSRAALAVMLARGSGGLLNVSSTASFVPGPTVAAYHASKAFVTSLTEALHVEAAGSDVHVTALCPGITPTGFQARAGTEHGHLPGFLTTSAERVAREGLAALGRNEALCVPGAANKLIATLARLAPRPVVRRVAGTFLTRV
jgi:uncharacterized protein